MEQILEFEVVFPGEERRPIKEYLQGGDRAVILNAAAFFLGFNNRKSKFRDIKELLFVLFGQANNGFANDIYKRIRVIEANTERQIVMINPFSSLNLFEHFFQLPANEVTQSKDQFEVNLFKAYLALNSEFTHAQAVAWKSTKHLDSELNLAMMQFCMNYPISDKQNFNLKELWITQIVKAIHLFQFIESKASLQTLLSAFLDHFQVNTWQLFLKMLISLTQSPLQNDGGETHTDIIVQDNESFEANCAFIEKLIVRDNDPLDANDFLTLRSRPIYKVKAGEYRIIFNLFMVEKIFKGLYFFLRDVNARLPLAHQVKELKSLFGDEFSERVLMYQTLEAIYPEKCTRFSGKDLSDLGIDGATDYYVRKGKHIMLFESKDFLIRADKKMSFDFDVYEKEFERVLYCEDLPNGKLKFKAVMQLIENIRMVLKQELADKDYSYKEAFIYPILVTHDLQFDTAGFNVLINSWFQDELELLKAEGLFVYHVRPLVIVNIDALIFNQVGLCNKLSLHEVLEMYVHQINHKPLTKLTSERQLHSYYLSKMIPFSVFIDNLFRKQGLKAIPPVLDSMAKVLFNEDIGTD